MGTKPELYVWWIPQVPMKSFDYEVPNIEAGKMLLDVLAKYDAFQFDNRVKPDYSNAGGLIWRHPAGTEGTWWDLDPSDEDDVAEYLRYCAV